MWSLKPLSKLEFVKMNDSNTSLKLLGSSFFDIKLEAPLRMKVCLMGSLFLLSGVSLLNCTW